MADAGRVLLVDDDPSALEALASALADAGYTAEAASDGPAALRLVGQKRFDLLIADADLASMDGPTLVARSRELSPQLPALLVTEDGAPDDALLALRAGAFGAIPRSSSAADFSRTVGRALEGRGEPSSERAPAGEPAPAAPEPRDEAREETLDEFDELVGPNPRMQRVLSLVRTVAPAHSSVLLDGEPGTGKARAAAAIHRRSPRATGPFVHFNCSAFGGAEVERELFGHVEGAFPGAARGRVGALRRADGGTLYLDEVSDLPAATQIKLLRAVQDRAATPVGGDDPLPVDARFVASTERDLAAEVRAGRFREDLYLRLGVIPIHLPALRERADDVPVLARRFLERNAAACGKRLDGFSEKAQQLLCRAPWPGNVRELENAVERAVVLAAGPLVDVDDLPPDLRGAPPPVDGALRIDTFNLAEVEEIVIRRVLAATNGNVKRSAQLLGVTRATLYAKIRRYELALTR